MKLNTKAMAITGALLWGGAVFATGLINLFQPRYGRDFLRMLATVYPGYKARGTFTDVLVGTMYAGLDGAGWGALSAVLYNRLAAREKFVSPSQQAAA
ncbi:MAG: hypothetical protein ACE14M_05625 [Terriglobales bacterium]